MLSFGPLPSTAFPHGLRRDYGETPAVTVAVAALVNTDLFPLSKGCFAAAVLILLLLPQGFGGCAIA